jgi:hypothetical protein
MFMSIAPADSMAPTALAPPVINMSPANVLIPLTAVSMLPVIAKPFAAVISAVLAELIALLTVTNPLPLKEIAPVVDIKLPDIDTLFVAPVAMVTVLP